MLLCRRRRSSFSQQIKTLGYSLRNASGELMLSQTTFRRAVALL